MMTLLNPELALHASPRRRALRQLLRNPAGVTGLILLLLIVIMALGADVFYPGDPLDMVTTPLLWPGAESQWLLGSDAMGRDLAAGIFHGSRVSLTIGLSAALVSLIMGVVVGALSGWYGVAIDIALLRLTTLFQTMPAFLLVVIAVAITTPSVTLIALAIGFTSWPTVARLVRAEFRVLREAEFILAARTQGFSSLRIMLQEMLPATLPSLIVTASVMVANAILMESALAFLGLGDPNQISWGSMIGSGREMLRTDWYLTAVPGLALVLAVLSLNLLGDALNDALNPRLRQHP